MVQPLYSSFLCALYKLEILQLSIKLCISFLVVAPKVVPNKYRNNCKMRERSREASFAAYVTAMLSLSNKLQRC